MSERETESAALYVFDLLRDFLREDQTSIKVSLISALHPHLIANKAAIFVYAETLLHYIAQDSVKRDRQALLAFFREVADKIGTVTLSREGGNQRRTHVASLAVIARDPKQMKQDSIQGRRNHETVLACNIVFDLEERFIASRSRGRSRPTPSGLR